MHYPVYQTFRRDPQVVQVPRVFSNRGATSTVRTYITGPRSYAIKVPTKVSIDG